MFEGLFQEAQEDLQAIEEWVDSIWEAKFEPSFAEARSLYSKLKNADVPISDTDLERIITILPLDMLEAAEHLNQLRLSSETFKLLNKDKETTLLRDRPDGMSVSDHKQMVELAMTERKLLTAAYNAIITRAENQMTFCREMIMSAKKIFDSRRSTEKAVPIGAPNTEDSAPSLPSYSGGRQQSYIK